MLEQHWQTQTLNTDEKLITTDAQCFNESNSNPPQTGIRLDVLQSYLHSRRVTDSSRDGLVVSIEKRCATIKGAVVVAKSHCVFDAPRLKAM